MLCKKLIILFLQQISLVALATNVQPITTIPQGKLQGQYLQSSEGKSFSAFTAIPYAQPPVGALRFKPPLPFNQWDGILNATLSASVCPQLTLLGGAYAGDEDCLFLNVYTPVKYFPTSTSLPVMIFLHGGGFMFGSGNEDSCSPKLLLNKDIVLVTLNYRLGPLGFISTGDAVAPGNNGLKDQLLAMKWVKRNIKYFGGNPNKITLFGESAGAASVHFHMMSPLSKNLFNAAILESGTAITPWALSANSETQLNTETLALSLNCSMGSNSEIIGCLRNVDAYDITFAQVIFYEILIDPIIPFKPTIEPDIEGAIITKHPLLSMKTGQIARIPTVIGMNLQEGALRAPAIFGVPGILEQVNDNFETLIPYFLLYHNTVSDLDYVTNKIREFYFHNETIDDSFKPQVTNMFTDVFFLKSISEVVRLLYKYQSVYFYAFGYRGTTSYSTLVGDPTYNYGVSHADELLYLLPSKEFFPTYVPSTNDKNMAKTLTTLWTNFANTRKPTLSSKWKTVESINLEYLLIKDSDDLEMKNKLYWERLLFMKSLPIGLSGT